VTLRAMLATLWFLIVPPAFALCESASEDLQLLKQLLSENPETLADRAVREKHFEFLAVAGYSLVLPGIDAPSCAFKRKQFHIIRGTSDVICSTEQGKLQADATAFAERYNRVLRRAVRGNATLCGDS
jgi:hypothetical protein